ncbi:MAG: preprotein translocase subunit SecE [Clostridiales bacterium]|nr:preprotein translocase subunit SecE [Clostridiales bacterium]
MGQNEKTAEKKQGKLKTWFQGLKAEFSKIVWTDRDTLIKQTIVVLVITIILAVIISIMDVGILQCINLLID